MHASAFARHALCSALVCGAGAAHAATGGGFKCDAYLGSIATDPPIASVFVKDDTNAALALADGRHRVLFEGYGDGMRITVTVAGDVRPLAIATFGGASGTVYARDGATDISISCVRPGS